MALPLLNDSYWYNGWSNVFTTVAKDVGRSGNFLLQLIPPNLYFQLLPFTVAIRSSILMFAYFYLLGVIMIFGKFFGKRVLGLIVSALIVVAGAGTSYYELSIMWFFPAAHAIVSRHYTEFFRKMYCSMETSYLYFLVMIFILCIGVYYKGRNLSFNKITDIE